MLPKRRRERAKVFKERDEVFKDKDYGGPNPFDRLLEGQDDLVFIDSLKKSFAESLKSKREYTPKEIKLNI